MRDKQKLAASLPRRNRNKTRAGGTQETNAKTTQVCLREEHKRYVYIMGRSYLLASSRDRLLISGYRDRHAGVSEGFDGTSTELQASVLSGVHGES